MLGKVATMTPAGNSLSGWETRLKLLGLLCLAFAFATIKDLRLLPLMVVTALAVYRLSGMPLRYLISRMKVPGVFLIAMAVVLPFFSGDTVLVQFGPVALRLEGTLGFVSIAARFFSIITVATVLFTSTPMPTLVRAMGSLGLPSLLGDMLLFAYRYIFQLADDLQRARTAARLRGARFGSLGSLKTVAYIVGSLLVRSHWQAERVLAAMTLRGYGNTRVDIARGVPGTRDLAAFAACITVGGAFVAAQTFFL